MQKQLVIQKIIFPNGDRFELNWDLFYRGSFIVKDQEGRHHLRAYQRYDFASYLNSLSMHKWMRYTDMKELSLKLRLSGKGMIHIVGYSLEPSYCVRKEYATYNYDCDKETEVVCAFPLGEDEQVAFEIDPYEDSIIYGGEYVAQYDEKDIRNIELAIATTTFKREEDIKANVKSIRKELIDSMEDGISEHLYIHVIDNGKTLTNDDISGKHVYLHPNNNVGGSGGFARGMIEALHQDPEVTHVLLLDDDVIVLPESIRRTYMLLSALRPMYYDAFVSGAMLECDQMYKQHEDVGCINRSGDTWMIKKRGDIRKLSKILYNNREFPKSRAQYQAWWYCCIPVQMIRRNGLPLPLFVRIDDMEYGIRSQTDILSMNGICIWHEGFTDKHNVLMDLYQMLRNRLIAGSTTNTFDISAVLGKCKEQFKRLILEYNYGGAELIVLALEDYIKGPEFFEQDNGEKIINTYRSFNEKMVSLNDIEGIEDINVVLEDVYQDPGAPIHIRLLYKLTLNGHKFISEKWLKDSVEIISYDWSMQPSKQAFHRKLLAVNVIDRTGCLRTINKVRYRELQKRFDKAWKYIEKHRNEIEDSYAAKREYLTSEEFWRKYLGIS